MQAKKCVPACLEDFCWTDACSDPAYLCDESWLPFSILITMSILKGQLLYHKHLEVIKLKGQGVEKIKDNMPPAGIDLYEQNFSPSKLRCQGPRT